MTNYFIVPGFGGSGPEHWQTYFERSGDNFQRIEQKDWSIPNIPEWIETIERAISDFDPQTVVLVGHSLGCLAIASWAGHYNKKIKAALLVAPPDIELLQDKLQKRLFDQIPMSTIKFKTILVASTNDPWATIEKAESYAKSWGSKFINIGAAGHINDLSGHYEWKQGLEILYSLG
ncbi:MAG: alpha/beta hydrolase [Bacteroidota bacterium]|nr:alpha/beta hydrolase [Bacteroidota bacterium]